MPQDEAGREPKQIGVDHDGPPPFLGQWGNVYAAVGAYLAALIALFTIFTWSLNK